MYSVVVARKQTSEVEERPFTSSLNIWQIACCRRVGRGERYSVRSHLLSTKASWTDTKDDSFSSIRDIRFMSKESKVEWIHKRRG
jgi:hypothetical protein